MRHRNWIEHTKTIILTCLILLSFVQTGYLLYSAPSLEEEKEGDYVRPPFIGDEKNNQQSVYQLAAPFQLIVHNQGRHAYALPKEKGYEQLFNTVRAGELANFTIIQPTSKQWKQLFQEWQGIELRFLQDSTIGQLDSFFKNTTLRDQPKIQNQNQISRIFFYINSQTDKIGVWFVSDETQTVIRADVNQLDHLVMQTQILAHLDNSPYHLTPYAVNNRPPWEETNEEVPFSRIIYIPTKPLSFRQYTYHLRQIDIEHMKQWLFKDPSVTPIQLNSNELLYMYNDPNMYNDQIITYNKQTHSMEYTNAPTSTERQHLLIREELDEINQFIQRHRGWTDTYLLDHVESEEHADEYTFRLFVDRLPVYWSKKPSKTPHPDTIQFQVKHNSVSKYVRSMQFLVEEPHRQQSVSLPGRNQLIQSIQKKKIPFTQIKQLYPGYQTKKGSDQTVTLSPVWIVKTLDGETHLLSSSTTEAD